MVIVTKVQYSKLISIMKFTWCTTYDTWRRLIWWRTIIDDAEILNCANRFVRCLRWEKNIHLLKQGRKLIIFNLKYLIIIVYKWNHFSIITWMIIVKTIFDIITFYFLLLNLGWPCFFVTKFVLETQFFLHWSNPSKVILSINFVIIDNELEPSLGWT